MSVEVSQAIEICKGTEGEEWKSPEEINLRATTTENWQKV